MLSRVEINNLRFFLNKLPRSRDPDGIEGKAWTQCWDAMDREEKALTKSELAAQRAIAAEETERAANRVSTVDAQVSPEAVPATA